MPNWCNTTYKCVGPKKSVKALNDIIVNLQNATKPRVKNGFGKMWLGCLIDSFEGFDWEKYPCRGWIEDFCMDDLDDGQAVLTIYQQTAWGEAVGVRYAINERFPDIQVYYSLEEPGFGLYVTNSYEWFPCRYRVDGYVAGACYVYEDCEDLEDVAAHLTNVFGEDIPADIDAINSYIEKWNKDHEDKDEYVEVNQVILE